MAKNFLKEFKEFAIRGNVLDLAVGVVVGTAFGKIVSSLVADIITPLISLTTGAVDFKHLSLPLREAAGGVSAVTINYGAFLQTIFDFLIIARSEEHTSELQSRLHLVCRLLLEKKRKRKPIQNNVFFLPSNRRCAVPDWFLFFFFFF